MGSSLAGAAAAVWALPESGSQNAATQISNSFERIRFPLLYRLKAVLGGLKFSRELAAEPADMWGSRHDAQLAKFPNRDPLHARQERGEDAPPMPRFGT